MTRRRRRLLGTVAGRCTRHSAAGRMVLDTWRALPDRFPTVVLDAFGAGPDHGHGILWFDDPLARRVVVAPVGAALVTAHPPGMVPADATLPRRADPRLHSWASRAGHRVRTHGWPRVPGRLRQRDYFERVIRTATALDRIRADIAGNPARWCQRHQR